MASQANGGIFVPGNHQVAGDADVNGNLNVDGATTVVTLAATGALSTGAHVALTPLASAPSPAAEGMLYAGTDHKLYFYNGSDWQEVAFV